MKNLALVVLGFAFSLPVFAAGSTTLADKKGKVMANQGAQFVDAQNGMALKPGDRVMAGPKSSASIRFSDGCVLRVTQETLVTIPAKSPCAGGVAKVQTVAPSGNGAVGATSGANPGAVAGRAAGSYMGQDAGFAGAVLLLFALPLLENNNDTISP